MSIPGKGSFANISGTGTAWNGGDTCDDIGGDTCDGIDGNCVETDGNCDETVGNGGICARLGTWRFCSCNKSLFCMLNCVRVALFGCSSRPLNIKI